MVHIDPPAEHKAYLHRSGRTARAGNAGDVVTVVLPEQRRDTQALMRRAGIRVTPQQVAADSTAVHALVGEMAPLPGSCTEDGGSRESVAAPSPRRVLPAADAAAVPAARSADWR